MSPKVLALVAAIASVADVSPRADPAVTVVRGAPAADALASQSRLRVAPGLKVELWAGEPLVKDITSFCFDAVGRAYVVETGRRRTSVFDIRGLQPWLDDDLSFRTVADRRDFLTRKLTAGDPDHDCFLAALTKSGIGGFRDFNRDGTIDARDLDVESERIRLVWDSDGDGRADSATTFADGFTNRVGVVAAGILAQGTHVWFTSIPDLWRLDAKASGPASGPGGEKGASGPTANSPARSLLLTGFGVHIAFGGHDLHGLVKGPDGRLYFTIADRGSSVTNREGRVISLPDCGAVFRCEPDGSDFEVFAKGLRNPQELCFDDFGNLWTCDNNADGGDKARWTLVLEGADYGWTIGWQWLPKLGAWNSERLWHTRESNTAAYIVPPVAYIGHGPAGIAWYPGTGMPARYDRHFFVTDFPGGLRTFAVEPDGAFFKVVPEPGADLAGRWKEDNSATNMVGKILWDLSPVDVAFPPGGGVTIADWVQGWEKTGKGRLWHVSDPAMANDPLIAETKRLLAEGMMKRGEKELLGLLGHRDQRVRLEAQFELEARLVPHRVKLFGKDLGAIFGGRNDVYAQLENLLNTSNNRLVRLHAVWALGTVARRKDPLFNFPLHFILYGDKDPIIQAQAARMLGESGVTDSAFDALLLSLTNADSRVRSEAALALWKVRRVPNDKRQLATRALLKMVSNDSPDGCVSEHAAVVGIVAFGQTNIIEAVFDDPSLRARRVALLAMRRFQDPQVVRFLNDSAPQLVLEAARTINDVPITDAMPALAALLGRDALRSGHDFSARGDAALPFTEDEWITWVLRRAVNANFRLGASSNAAALGDFAARTDAPESVRVEAIEDLGDWAKPPGRDKIVGLWRPLPPRDPGPARSALGSVWNGLAADTSTNVVLAAVRAGVALGTAGFADKLAALREHPDPVVRAEVAKLRDGFRPATLAELTARLERGLLREQQAALAALAVSDEAGAGGVLAAQMEKLLTATLSPSLALDVLEAATRRAARPVDEAARAGSPGTRLTAALAAWTNSLPKGDVLAPFGPVLAGGDAANGRLVIVGRQDLACFRCHKFRGEGGDVGPDLTGIGRSKGRGYVLRSILFPNAEIAAGYENVVVTRKDGTSVAGVLKSESPAELVLASPEDGLVTVKKSDIAARERGPSSMVEGLGELMSLREMRDVVEALSE